MQGFLAGNGAGRRTVSLLAAAAAAAYAAAAWAGPALAASQPSAGPTCPRWVGAAGAPRNTESARAAALPAVAYVAGSASVGPRSAVLQASVRAGAGAVALTAEYWRAGRPAACTAIRRTTKPRVEVALPGLRPATRYRVRLAATRGGGTVTSATVMFVTLPAGTVAEDVSVGDTQLGRAPAPAARARLARWAGAPVRLAYSGARWRVLPSRLGVHVDVAGTVRRVLAADPGTALPQLRVTVDRKELAAYVASLARRFDHRPSRGSVLLVGKRAEVVPQRGGVTVETRKAAALIAHELLTGERALVQLPVKKTPAARAAAQKAVVVRLGSQTLTAYLNGKPVLRTPVTTGRPALPTPIGSYTAEFRASPYVFHSPWPPGNPYWYPPTPVTWAIEFYDGDFLHDDPGEPDSAFGSDSENGYFASHGCVHVPHDAMAVLWNWLPAGAPVIVAQD